MTVVCPDRLIQGLGRRERNMLRANRSLTVASACLGGYLGSVGFADGHRPTVANASESSDLAGC